MAGRDPFNCELCRKTFGTKKMLRQHISYCDKKPEEVQFKKINYFTNITLSEGLDPKVVEKTLQKAYQTGKLQKDDVITHVSSSTPTAQSQTVNNLKKAGDTPDSSVKGDAIKTHYSCLNVKNQKPSKKNNTMGSHLRVTDDAIDKDGKDYVTKLLRTVKHLDDKAIVEEEDDEVTQSVMLSNSKFGILKNQKRSKKKKKNIKISHLFSVLAEDKTKTEGTSFERSGQEEEDKTDKTEAAEKDDITVGAQEVAEKEGDVSYILLKALKKAHRRYLEDSSTSNDESARSLEKLEELASRLSSLCAGSATEDSSPLILKILKAGIDYAFTLPRDGFAEVFNYLGDQSRKANTLEGPSIGGSWLTFAEILHQKELSEEEDEPVTLATSPSGGEASRFPNQIGRESEKAAYNYFSSSKKYQNVKWVNEDQESGKPFDIILTACDGKVEYVEVKSTTLPNKKWFYISLNELEFALKKGAAYSIVHVSKSDVGDLNLITYRNMENQLRSRKFKLLLHPVK